MVLPCRSRPTHCSRLFFALRPASFAAAPRRGSGLEYWIISKQPSDVTSDAAGRRLSRRVFRKGVCMKLTVIICAGALTFAALPASAQVTGHDDHAGHAMQP